MFSIALLSATPFNRSQTTAMRKYNYSRLTHSISATAFIAENATVLGDVSIGDEASVWFGAVIRGDVEAISIGSQTNIQDLCVLHADPGLPCLIGDRVIVGHGAVVHGAVVGNDSLIGIRAVVLNGAKIGMHCLVGAGCLVPEGFEVPDNSVVMGVPARIVRQTTDADRQRHQLGVQNYVHARLHVPSSQ